MSEPYFYEFLWRDRDPEDTTPPAFHIGLCAKTPDPFGGPPQYHERILNMAQAEEFGWKLPDAIAAINAEALRYLEAANETIAARDEALAEAKAEAEGLTAQLNAAMEELNKRAAKINAAVAIINDRDAQIAALREGIARDEAGA